MYFGTFGFVVTIVIGILVSYATGYQNPETLPKGVTFLCKKGSQDSYNIETNKMEEQEKSRDNESFVEDASPL